jgi:uncharacterized protein (TIGR02452 family)
MPSNEDVTNCNGKSIDLKTRTQESCKATKFYSSDSVVKEWATPTTMTSSSIASGSDQSPVSPTHISVLQISTIDAARLLDDMYHNNPTEAGNVIGVLNFASALKPGGGFLNGLDGQEQSIARASTLHSTLVTSEAQKFYKLHGSQNIGGYYSHGMIYSPKVTVFRDDDGRWAPKFMIDVLSCAAVNVNMVLNNATANKPATLVSVEKEMKERMGRILFLFERTGVRNIILGAFGTGSFYNDVATVARIWAQLLVVPSARFKKSFDRVIFAIMGNPTYDLFNDAFGAWERHENSSLGEEGIHDSDSEFASRSVEPTAL